MRVSWCFLVVMWSACSVAAQDLGSLTGRVGDETGEALFGANIVVKGPAIEGRRGAITDAQGYYLIDQLPAGIYELTISYIGYETRTVPNVEIRAGERVTRDFVLTAVSLVGQQVVVSASRKREKALDAPASISMVNAAEIRDRQVLSVTEHVKALPGVDYSQTGISQGNMVVRGFNNVFSGALLTLVDNRIARIPSLRFNAYHLIPVTGDDIERIEVVLGPGSALYGPNSAQGVMHIITRSPIGSEGSTISISGGERSLRKVSLRHASSFNDKVGIKISGGYFAGHDWEYIDPQEVRSILEEARNLSENWGDNDPQEVQAFFRRIKNAPTSPEARRMFLEKGRELLDRGENVDLEEADALGFNPRDYDTARRIGEIRLDFRPTDELTLIGSAGYTSTNSLELTGLGAGQAKDWTYNFLQGRMLYRGWFAQIFYNTSNAGDTKLLLTDDGIVDKSHLMVFQLQHSASLWNKQHFAYGVDVLRTRPQTEGTVNGFNEDRDNIDEFGLYLQSETNLTDQLEVVLAGRIDKHNHIDNPVFSPRAALVVKPSVENTLRFTYNRAFDTPSTSNLFLDRVGIKDVYGLAALGQTIDLRAQGTAGGFTFRQENGLPMFRSAFAPLAGLSADHYFAMHDPQATNLMWQVARGAILAVLAPQLEPLATGIFTEQLGLPPDQATAVAKQLVADFPRIIPETLPNLQNSAATLNTETRGFDPVTDLANAVTDIKKIESTITETFEVGYKGIVKNKLILAADVYRTTIKNFVGPLRIETPNVFLEAGSLTASLEAGLNQTLADPANASLAIAVGLLDQLNQPDLGLVGNGNGSGIDELTQLFVSNAVGIPLGTISAEQASDPAAVMVTYRNFGRISLYGADLSFAYYPNETWTFMGNYSYVSEDLFPDLDDIGDIALNAPRHKFNIGAECRLPNTPLTLGGKLRYRGSFPMNSGVYMGPVDSHTIIDLNASYQLPLSNDRFKLILSAEANNLLNEKYRSFVGAPLIGRMLSGGLTVRF